MTVVDLEEVRSKYIRIKHAPVTEDATVAVFPLKLKALFHQPRALLASRRRRAELLRRDAQKALSEQILDHGPNDLFDNI